MGKISRILSCQLDEISKKTAIILNVKIIKEIMQMTYWMIFDMFDQMQYIYIVFGFRNANSKNKIQIILFSIKNNKINCNYIII